MPNGTWNVTFRTLGVIVSAVSIFNLARRYGELELSLLFERAVASYEFLAMPIGSVLNSIVSIALSVFGIDIPPIHPDIFVIYIIIGSAWLRLMLAENDELPLSIGTAVFWPFVLLLIGIAKLTKNDSDADETFEEWVKEAMIVVLAAAVFISLNSVILWQT